MWRFQGNGAQEISIMISSLTCERPRSEEAGGQRYRRTGSLNACNWIDGKVSMCLIPLHLLPYQPLKWVVSPPTSHHWHQLIVVYGVSVSNSTAELYLWPPDRVEQSALFFTIGFHSCWKIPTTWPQEVGVPRVLQHPLINKNYFSNILSPQNVLTRPLIAPVWAEDNTPVWADKQASVFTGKYCNLIFRKVQP